MLSVKDNNYLCNIIISEVVDVLCINVFPAGSSAGIPHVIDQTFEPVGSYDGVPGWLSQDLGVRREKKG